MYNGLSCEQMDVCVYFTDKSNNVYLKTKNGLENLNLNLDKLLLKEGVSQTLLAHKNLFNNRVDEEIIFENLFLKEQEVNVLSVKSKVTEDGKCFVKTSAIPIKKLSAERFCNNAYMVEQIINIMPGHVYWKNKSGVLLGCNDELLDSFGQKREEAIGSKPENILTDAELENIKSVDSKVLKGETVIAEEPGMLKDGREAIFLTKKAPLKNSDDSVVGVIGVSIDISDIKQAEKAKNNFIRDMGHDFRTPLTGIKGTADVLLMQSDLSETQAIAENITKLSKAALNAKTPEERKKIIEKIAELSEGLKNDLSNENMIAVECLKETDNACVRLLDFFDEVLVLAKSTSGIEKNELASTDTNVFFESLKDLYAPTARNKGIKLNVVISDEVPGTLLFDHPKLRRILMNLLGNALKFTDKGAVSLVTTYDTLNKQLSMVVSDTAGGIPKNKLETIFGSFTQLADTDKSRGGYGLGLNIVKNYLNIIDGTITVESELGKGSEFVVKIPVDQVPEN